MKFRCTTNSIRLRVRKSDLETLRNQGKISDSVAFGNGKTFVFAIETGAGPQMLARFEDGRILVQIPRQKLADWMESEEVSLEYAQALEEGHTLQVLVEKDFPCRHTTESNREDTFYELAPEDPTVC